MGNCLGLLLEENALEVSISLTTSVSGLFRKSTK